LQLFSALQLFSSNDKYRIVLTDDPASAITIAWNQISGSNPIVYYDTIDHGTDYNLYAFSKTVDRSVQYRGMDNQFVNLSGLVADKAYYFVIHDSEGTSNRYWFKTSPNDLSRLSIIAGGDSRTNRAPRQRANLLVSKLKPHAILFGGDMTEHDTDQEWKNWMDDWQNTIADDGRMFPVIPAQGNHERHEVIYKLFNTPGESYYYTTAFGDNLLRIYTLNTQVSVSGNQLVWLKDDLNDNTDIIWKVAQYHKPMRPHTEDKDENDAAYDAWAQLFYDNDVRLIVESDAHTVKETWPVEPSLRPGNDEGFIQNDTYGCVFIGEGGWGAPLRANNDDKSWTRNSGRFYQFKLLFIDDSKIEVRTIKTDNAEEVGEVSNDDPFTLPANLDVWDPSNGAVVELFPAPPMNKPDIEFTENTAVVYLEGDDISLEVEVLDIGNGIDEVSFYVNNSLEETVSDPPYIFNHSYADGHYKIEAVATDIDDLIDAEVLNISVGNFSETAEAAIKNGQDDVEETEAGLVYFNSSDLEMMFDDYEFDPDVPNGFQKIGLRFQNVSIPAGAIIDSAYIQFRSDETDDTFAEFLIFAENSNNAAPFDDGDSLSVSARTTFIDSVYWTPPAWTETGIIGPAQKTPDVRELLQQIIDKSDWISGNDIVFKIVGTGVSLTDEDAIRVADSYEGKPAHPATLIYTYSFDAELVNVDEENPKTDSYVFPNPFSNTLYFNIPAATDQMVMVQITDILGKVLLSKTVSMMNNKFTINSSIQKNGVYIVTVVSLSNDELLKQKIMKY
jgi:hypothetical protein